MSELTAEHGELLLKQLRERGTPRVMDGPEGIKVLDYLDRLKSTYARFPADRTVKFFDSTPRRHNRKRAKRDPRRVKKTLAA